MKDLSYSNIWMISNSIARQLVLLKNKKGYEPNLHLIEESKKMVEDMQYCFLSFDDVIGKTKEWKFYDKLFFGNVQFYDGPTGSIPDYGELREYSIGKEKSKNLIKRRVDSTEKTIEKILSGKKPTKKELVIARELFNYIYEESYLNMRWRGPYGEMMNYSQGIKGLAA